MEDKKVVLELKDISKSFPGVKALDKVSFTLKKGTVHALMGENGAGKSTLMKCAFGLYDPDEGEVYFNGEKVHFENPRQGLEAGISMIHQELNPIRRRSIAENIWVGRMPEKKIAGISLIDHKRMYKDTQKLFDELHVSVDPKTQAIELSSSILQLGEIARSISYGAKVIIMDVKYSIVLIVYGVYRVREKLKIGTTYTNRKKNVYEVKWNGIGKTSK